MGNYAYDSKVNRDLARTAMSIYTKSHNIQPINESTQNINEEVLRENINSLILNYVSDVIVLAEQELGREMTDVEINEASIELLNRINSISDEDKTNFVTQLAEEAGAMGARGGGAVSAGKGRGSTAVSIGAGAGSGGAIANFDPSNYDGTSEASIEQLFRDVASGMYGEGAVAGSLLSQVLANQQSSPGIGTSTRSAAQRSGAARRRLGEAIAANNLPVNNYSYGNQVGAGAGQITSNTPNRSGTTVAGTFKRPKNRAGGGIGDIPVPNTDNTLSDYGPDGTIGTNFGSAITALYADLGYDNANVDFDPSVAGQLAAQLQTLYQ